MLVCVFILIIFRSTVLFIKVGESEINNLYLIVKSRESLFYII